MNRDLIPDENIMMVPELLQNFNNRKQKNKRGKGSKNKVTVDESNLYDKAIDIFYDIKEIKSAERRRQKSLETFEEYLKETYDVEPDY